jgi:hypothetical protein
MEKKYYSLVVVDDKSVYHAAIYNEKPTVSDAASLMKEILLDEEFGLTELAKRDDIYIRFGDEVETKKAIEIMGD